jgi:hypothetical protein
MAGVKRKLALVVPRRARAAALALRAILLGSGRRQQHEGRRDQRSASDCGHSPKRLHGFVSRTDLDVAVARRLA